MPRTVFAALASVLALPSCRDVDGPPSAGGDLRAPVIRLAGSVPALASGTVCGEDAGGTVLEARAGQDIRVDLELEDDVALAQYKLDVHHNFDCHSHQKRSAAAGEPWTLVALRDAAGRSLARAETLRVPEGALAGAYHLMIRCLDAAGNEAPYLEINLRIGNSADTVMPVLALEDPSGDSLLLRKADSLVIAGRLEDDRSLAGGRVDLSYTDSAGTVFTVGSRVAGAGSTASFSFRFAYRFPPFAKPGRYRLRLDGFDAVNNTYRRELWLVLSES